MQTPVHTVVGFAALIIIAAASEPAAAQQIELGGRAYIDYFYTVSSPVEEDEGSHGFTYRRLYLTSDFALSEDFFGRARLEAHEGTQGPRGPEPFVKDLWVAWQYSGDHTATLGVMPPPVFEIAEDVWQYRSLEKTILDFQNVNSSRDFGIRFDGPLGSSFRYAAMLANNSGVSPEDDNYKRLYGQLAYYPTETLVVSVGADRAGYAPPGESGTRVSGFGGYVSDALNLGVEVYWSELTFDLQEDFQAVGASVFSSVAVASRWELVGRVDFVTESIGDVNVNENFVLLGAAYRPHQNIRIIPNLWLFNTDQTDESETLARITVDVRF